MGKNKLKHFEEMLSFPNVYQLDKSKRGNWSNVFGNHQPITLELACGKGDYAVGLARLYPETNFIGVDIKGARIYTGAKNALVDGLDNVRFLRTQIDHLPEYFSADEVNEIWITFPDPHLPLSTAHRRLTSPKYIDVYRQILRQGGNIHLKTDDDTLYRYTLDIIEALNLKLLEKIDDVYGAGLRNVELDIRTYYEKKHLAKGKIIKYIRVSIA